MVVHILISLIETFILNFVGLHVAFEGAWSDFKFDPPKKTLGHLYETMSLCCLQIFDLLKLLPILTPGLSEAIGNKMSNSLTVNYTPLNC